MPVPASGRTVGKTAGARRNKGRSRCRDDSVRGRLRSDRKRTVAVGSSLIPHRWGISEFLHTIGRCTANSIASPCDLESVCANTNRDELARCRCEPSAVTGRVPAGRVCRFGQAPVTLTPAGRIALSGMPMPSARAVNTNGPSSVIAIVCSLWAPRDPSAADRVQPSSSRMIRLVVASSHGSIASTRPASRTRP